MEALDFEEPLEDSDGALSTVARIPSRKRKNRRPNLDSTSMNDKRQRVSQACHHCHSKKEKCDGHRPACSTCLALKQTCVYTTATRRRGLPAGYVHVLEMVWGLVFSKIAGSDDVVDALLRRPSNHGSHAWLTVIKDGGEDAGTLREIWRKSRACGLIHELLTRAKGMNENTLPIENSSSHLSDWRLPLTWTDATSLGKETSIEAAEHNGRGDLGCASVNHETLLSQASIGGDETSRKLSGVLYHSNNGALGFVLPSNCWHLLDIYFTLTHCWLPILEKHDVYRAAYASSGKPLSATDMTSNSGEYAALWALLAYTSAHEAAVRPLETSDTGTNLKLALSSDELYTRARSLIPSEDAEFDIGHVQALLLLGLYKLGYGSKISAWLLVSHAVRLAVAMGMDDLRSGRTENTIHGKRSATDRSHHVLLGCFVLETLISMVVGRSTYFKSQSITRAGLLQEDGLEEWEPWSGPMDTKSQSHPKLQGSDRRPAHTLSVFNQLVQISCILNDFLHGLQHGFLDNQHYVAFETKIADWHSELPHHCQFSPRGISNFSKNNPPLPHSLNLQLTYVSFLAVLQHQAFRVRIAPSSSASREEARKMTAISANTIMCLLQQYHTVYPTSIPSTFVYFTNLAQTIARYDGSGVATSFENEHQSFLIEMAKIWPKVAIMDKIPLPYSLGGKIEPLFHAANLLSKEPDSIRNRPDFLADSQRYRNRETYEVANNPIEQEMTDVYMAEASAVPPLSEPSEVMAPISQEIAASTQVMPHGLLTQPSPQRSTTGDWRAGVTTSPFPITSSISDSLTSPDTSIFDQLASLDSTEWLDMQPQFIQNLGFDVDDISLGLSSYHDSTDERSNRPHMGTASNQLDDMHQIIYWFSL